VTALVVALVALAVLAVAGVYLTWLGGRHDRLTARADGAWAALDAQLARRAAAGRAVAVTRGEEADDVVRAAAEPVLAAARETAPSAGRQDAENALGRAMRAAGYERLDNPEVAELRSAAQRVLLARQFHNDAVRDLLAIRGRPTARLLRWARGGTQRYFEIDDTVLTGPVRDDEGRPGL
jgi:hypothetical protein